MTLTYDLIKLINSQIQIEDANIETNKIIQISFEFQESYSR